MIFLFIDGYTEIGSSFMLGIGRMGIGAAMTFVGFFMLGLPTSVYLAINAGFGIRGIWTGAVVACVFLVVFYNIYILCLDW